MDKETVWATIVSGLATNVIFHPLDTVRVIHQTSSVQSPAQYWLRPLSRYWQGLTPAIVFSVPAWVVDVIAYRETKKSMGENGVNTYLIAGAVAQITSSVFWTPMNIVCGRLQLRDPQASRSLSKEMASIFKNEGLYGFFRGYWLGVGIYLPYTMTWWSTYDVLKKKIGVTAASGTATIIGEAISNIFCVVRTRLQMATSPDLQGLRSSDRLGVTAVFKNLLAEAGVGRALVRGLHIKLLTAIPMSICSMSILEYMSPDKVGK